MLNIVLYQPRIPQNTGQIARACLAMGCALHVIRPLGFRLDAPGLRRAAVGYLAEIPIRQHEDSDAFWQAAGEPRRVWLITRHGAHDYRDAKFASGDYLLFGSETEGLPGAWLEARREQTLRIPMANPQVRCLNLATAVDAVMFEALRQLRTQPGFPPAL